MRAGGAGLPWAARVLIGCAGGGAALCAAPAVAGFRGTEWGVVLPLAALYALSEYAPRCRVLGPRVPGNLSAFFPILLTGAFLLPPAASALVPLPGALIGRVEQRHAAARRLWHMAQLALAAFVAARVRGLLSGGPITPAAAPAGAAEGRTAPSGTAVALSVPGLPAALLGASLAALAFSAVLAVLDGAVLVAAERCPPRSAWRGQLSSAAVPVLVHGFAGLMMAMLWRSPYGPFSALFVLLPMYLCCWVHALYHRERAAHQSTIRALVQAVDIKDRYTRGHSERVGRASVLIARELGMDESRTEALRFAGILHDVGKLGVPTRLLRKDGPLTAEERGVIELHPEYGHEMVRGIGFLGEARSAILHHHERLDGSGYPYGLSGTQIPEFARVVAVADAFDAMTSTRSYRRARPVSTAVQELRRCAGTQFDPQMVGALADALAREGWSPAATTDGPGGPSGNVPPARGGSRVRDLARPLSGLAPAAVDGTAAGPGAHEAGATDTGGAPGRTAGARTPGAHASGAPARDARTRRGGSAGARGRGRLA